MEIMEDFPVDGHWKMPQVETHVTINRREKSKMDARKTLKGESSLGVIWRLFAVSNRSVSRVCRNQAVSNWHTTRRSFSVALNLPVFTIACLRGALAAIGASPRS